jgi:hypothetical protein
MSDLYDLQGAVNADLDKLDELITQALVSPNLVSEAAQFRAIQGKYAIFPKFNALNISSHLDMVNARNQFIREQTQVIAALESNYQIINAAAGSNITFGTIDEVIGFGTSQTDPTTFDAGRKLEAGWKLVQDNFPNVSNSIPNGTGRKVAMSYLGKLFHLSHSLHPDRTINAIDDIGSKCLTQGHSLKTRKIFYPIVGSNDILSGNVYVAAPVSAETGGCSANTYYSVHAAPAIPLNNDAKGSTITVMLSKKALTIQAGGTTSICGVAGLNATQVEVYAGAVYANAVLVPHTTVAIDPFFNGKQFATIYIPNVAGQLWLYFTAANAVPRFFKVVAVEEGKHSYVADNLSITIATKTRLIDYVGFVHSNSIDQLISDEAWDILAFIKNAVTTMNIIDPATRMGASMAKTNPGIVRASNEKQQLMSATAWLTGALTLGSSNNTTWTGATADCYRDWYQMLVDVLYLAVSNKRFTDSIQEERLQ